MIIPSEFTVVCHRLESELQKAGLVFGDVQFDESEQALRIVVEAGKRQLSKSPRTDSGTDHRCKSVVGSSERVEQTRDESSHPVAAQTSGSRSNSCGSWRRRVRQPGIAAI